MQFDAESDPMTQSESDLQSFQKIGTVSGLHLGHGQLFLQTSRMYGQERKRSRDSDTRMSQEVSKWLVNGLSYNLLIMGNIRVITH